MAGLTFVTWWLVFLGGRCFCGGEVCWWGGGHMGGNVAVEMLLEGWKMGDWCVGDVLKGVHA
jgi:hypothetical protein